MAFVKLDCGILTSTTWMEKDLRDMFITALLMAVPHELIEPEPEIEINSLNPTGWVVPPGWYGFVHAAGPGIARMALLDKDKGLAALEVLSQPEPESRTQDYEGRRMVRVNGGFIVLNFQKYRDKDHTAAERQRRYRQRQKGVALRRDVTSPSRNITQAEAEAKAKSIATLKRDDGSIGEVFSYWQHVFDHPRSKLDAKRRQCIKQSLKIYEIEDLKKAIDGCSLTPHNMGDNDSGAIYDDIRLILRDASQIDRFMANAENPPTGSRIKTIDQSNRAAEAQTKRILTYIDPFEGTN